LESVSVPQCPCFSRCLPGSFRKFNKLSSFGKGPESPARASGFGQSGSEVIDSTFVLVGW